MAILSFDWSLQMYFSKQKNNQLFFASLVRVLDKLYWLNWKLWGRQNIIDILNWNDEISRILCKVPSNSYLASSSGGELLELRLLDTQLLNTFGSKSIARHKIDKLLESSLSWLNRIRANSSSCHFFCDSKM